MNDQTIDPQQAAQAGENGHPAGWDPVNCISDGDEGCPFVPIDEITKEETKEFSDEAARALDIAEDVVENKDRPL